MKKALNLWARDNAKQCGTTLFEIISYSTRNTILTCKSYKFYLPLMKHLLGGNLSLEVYLYRILKLAPWYLLNETFVITQTTRKRGQTAFWRRPKWANYHVIGLVAFDLYTRLYITNREWCLWRKQQEIIALDIMGNLPALMFAIIKYQWIMVIWIM